MSFDTRIFWQSFPVLIGGAWVTVVLVAVSLAIGVCIGLLACVGRLVGHGLLYRLSALYVGLFRGLPETVLIFWIYYCGPLVFEGKLSSFQSATAALSITSGAYLAEIFRAGIEAIPRGQLEAGRAVGLSSFWLVWDVVAPQAIRIMIVPFLGLVTILIKNSALVSAIGVAELFYRANILASENFQYFAMLTAAAVIYFVMICPISIFLQRHDKRFTA
jgi:His/Glu/Gln/Arg/opine family amino acid ABC transporter permease subunit